MFYKSREVDGLSFDRFSSILGFKEKVAAIKAAEFIALKTMKNVPSSLKLALIAVCTLTDAVAVDTAAEATAKKMVQKMFLTPLSLNVRNYFCLDN